MADLAPRKCRSKKKCFQTPAEADVYIVELAKVDHPSRFKRVGVYLCACGWFHIGHNFGPVHERTARRGKHRRLTPSPS